MQAVELGGLVDVNFVEGHLDFDISARMKKNWRAELSAGFVACMVDDYKRYPERLALLSTRSRADCTV